MPVAKLLVKVADHYSRRGLPASAIAALQTRIADGISGGDLKFGGDYDFCAPVGKLADRFPRCPSNAAAAEGDLTRADAIFAFSFGYRRKTRPAPGEESRLPGPNNRALAEICSWLKSSRPGLKLCAQFEIADALADYTSVQADVSTAAEDIGTGGVIKRFLADVPQAKSIIIVAHRHHIDRCHILLREDFGLESTSSPREYDGYDTEEAQPRVRSPSAFIISDFVSLAARIAKC